MTRTLVAGFGNTLRGDDGFGVAVVHRLAELDPWSDDDRVILLEVGTGGLHLAQELLSGYDRLIVVDAMTRGGAPGTVYVREVEGVEAARQIDLHLVIPAKALSVAKALGALPRRVYMVGCEPAQVDELCTGLSPVVRSAVAAAIERIRDLVASDAPVDEGAVQPR